MLLVGVAMLAWAYRTWSGSGRRPRRDPSLRRRQPPSSTAPASGASSTRAARGAVAAIDEPMLRLTLPSGWERQEAPGLFAQFVHQSADFETSMLTVVLGNATASTSADDVIDAAMEAHAHSLAQNHRGQMDAQPVRFRTIGPVRDATRTYLCQAEGSALQWRVTARYASTLEPMALRGTPFGRPLVQITVYESPWSSEAMERVISDAQVVPLLSTLDGPGSTGSVVRYPYVVHDDGVAQRDAALVHAGQRPEGSAGMVHLGGPLHLTVAEDHPDTVRPLFPSDVIAQGGTLPAWLQDAGERVGRELASGDIPVHVYDVSPGLLTPLWQEGVHVVVGGLPTVKLMVVGPTWKAASSIGSRALYQRAVQELGTSDLRALVPHRDRLFVFAAMPEPLAETFVQAIVRAEEPYARKPLSNAVFRLEPGKLSR
jgi:hypothetical protein